MKNFIQSTNVECQKVIKKDLYIPKKIENNVEVKKDEDDFDYTDWKKCDISSKALNLLCFALEMNEHNKLSVGKSTKEVWNKLEITYE